MADVDVLVVGAGPVGLTAAIELARRGVRCRIIDQLAEPMTYAKAVGIQPRTLEVWDAMGVVREALDAAEPMLGQQVYVNGAKVSALTLALPADVPYRFAALPQYEVERILTRRLAGLGVHVERDTRLVSFEQDAERVEAVLARGVGEADEQITARYLIGCDGAHRVRDPIPRPSPQQADTDRVARALASAPIRLRSPEERPPAPLFAPGAPPRRPRPPLRRERRAAAS